MAAVETASKPPSPGLAPLSRIVAAGLLGGALDFIYASFLTVVLVGAPFARVWQGVATGWLGPAALEQGWASAGLGIATHFAIAVVMAGAYAVAATRLPALYRRRWIAGVLYGLILYLVMYRVVLPLRFPETFPRWDGVQSLMDIAAHIGVGVVIAVVLSRRRD
jgi:hypothetical protein